MCYAIPGRVENLEGKIAIIDYFGEQKKAYNEIDKLKIGDYVYAQGGYVIERLSKEKALSTLQVWKETFFELQEKDLLLSKMQFENKNLDKRLLRILDKVSQNLSVSQEDYLDLLKRNNPNELNLIYKTANFIRHKNFGNACCVHGIIELSNQCARNCQYCGISVYNENLVRYKMLEEEILETAEMAIKTYGFKALVLQSGQDAYSVDELFKIIKKIKEKFAVLIFISVGEIGKPGLEKLYEAGARGVLLRFETSNSILFEKMHPGYKLETRVQELKNAYKMGYLILTGGLIGLPGQTEEDILNDIFLAKSLNAEMFSFGPFVPHPKTPLGKAISPTSQFMMKVLAVARFIDQDMAKILITTAFETIDKTAREEGLLSGANSVMLNVTPKEYKEQYTIYPNRAYLNKPVLEQIQETISLLQNIGRSPTDLGLGESSYDIEALK